MDKIDYIETFASVIKPISYKAIFAFAAALDWEIEQINVKIAFLYGLIKERVYIEQPHRRTLKNPHLVYELRKALYGLKQSPRV